jgi:hypothetical protein
MLSECNTLPLLVFSRVSEYFHCIQDCSYPPYHITAATYYNCAIDSTAIICLFVLFSLTECTTGRSLRWATNTYTYIHTHTPTHTYTRLHTHTHIHTYTQTGMYSQKQTCTHTHTNINSHISTHTPNTYIYIHSHIHRYKLIYSHTDIWLRLQSQNLILR